MTVENRVGLVLVRTERIVDPEDAEARLDVTTRDYFAIGELEDYYTNLKPGGVPIDLTEYATSDIGFTPNFDTHENLGTLAWSVSISAHKVPGVLRLAWWSGLDEPPTLSSIDNHTLGAAAESTAGLAIGSYSTDPEIDPPEVAPWAKIGWAFYPSHLAALLPP